MWHNAPMDDTPRQPAEYALPPRYAEVVVNVPLHHGRKGTDDAAPSPPARPTTTPSPAA